jgi:hypothetical protein
LIGALIGYYLIKLKPVDTNAPIVDVKVEVPEPMIIKDTITNTITNTEVKYKYLNKDKCYCDCRQKDTIE